MDFLRATGLTRIYGDRSVVHDVNLTVQRGEQVALLGPSGSGKSTLLHLLGGLELPNLGEVRLLDVALNRLSRKELARLRREHVGTVFQFFHLLPILSAAENVALPLRLKGWEEGPIRARVDALLARVGLTHRSQARPSELSGGEMQRVAVARALAGKPSLVLADEPTGNLDRHSGQEVLDLFTELATEEGATVIMVTHSEAAARGFHRVLWMEDGQVTEQVPDHAAMP